MKICCKEDMFKHDEKHDERGTPHPKCTFFREMVRPMSDKPFPDKGRSCASSRSDTAKERNRLVVSL